LFQFLVPTVLFHLFNIIPYHTWSSVPAHLCLSPYLSIGHLYASLPLFILFTVSKFPCSYLSNTSLISAFISASPVTNHTVWEEGCHLHHPLPLLLGCAGVWC
jgi:hypothetical protein